jgi:hypothetical protein
VRDIAQSEAADQVAYDDSTLSSITVLKANDDHTVATWTAAPAIGAVFIGDAPRHNQLVIA